MKMKRILLFFMILINTSFVHAHPPRNMEVSYSKEEKVLSLKMIHVTSNNTSRFVSKIEIQRENGDIKKKIYYRQKYLKKVEKDIPIELNPNENILIKVYCNKGGVLKQSFVVPQEETQEDKNEDKK